MGVNVMPKSKNLFWVALLGTLVIALSGCLFKPSEGGIISIGAPYELVNMVVRGDYPDTDEIEVTDGKIGDFTSPGHGPWSGMKLGEDATAPTSIIIDLGSTKPVGSVGAYVLHGAWGISAPTKLNISVSDDKETWTTPVSVARPADLSGNAGVWFTGAVNKPGRYVKCEFDIASGWLWISEITVIQGE